jgi:hypothetical protein
MLADRADNLRRDMQTEGGEAQVAVDSPELRAGFGAALRRVA